MKFNCYYKHTDSNGIVTLHGCNKKPASVSDSDVITYEKYEELRAKFQKKPNNTLESIYYFDWETEMYLPRERTEDETVQWYQEQVDGGMSLEEVPVEYRDKITVEVVPDPTQELINEIIAEVNA